MKVLGLDPSLTNYGWCLIDMDQAPTIVLGKGVFQTKPNMLFIERYMFLRESIYTLCNRYSDLKYVGIESPPFGEIWSEGLYGLFLFAIEALYKSKKNIFFWDPSTVKSRAKEILGRDKGKMFKIDMIAAAKKMSGDPKWSSDTADAFNVAHLTSRFIDFLHDKLTEGTLTDREKWIFTGYKKIIRTGEIRHEDRGMIFKENNRYFLFDDPT